jgi:hypothetical protein
MALMIVFARTVLLGSFTTIAFVILREALAWTVKLELGGDVGSC